MRRTCADALPNCVAPRWSLDAARMESRQSAAALCHPPTAPLGRREMLAAPVEAADYESGLALMEGLVGNAPEARQRVAVPIRCNPSLRPAQPSRPQQTWCGENDFTTSTLP